MALTPADIVTTIFNNLTPNINTFIQGDLLTVISAFTAISFIIFAATKIYELLHLSAVPDTIVDIDMGDGDLKTMSNNERDAREAFEDYKEHRGKFDAPIYQRRYNQALRRYEQMDL